MDAQETLTLKTPQKMGKRRRGRPPFLNQTIKIEGPILKADNYTPLTDLDLSMYLESIHDNKLLGMTILD